MNAIVIDTNVLAVADGLHGHISSHCIAVCIAALEEATKKHCVVIDKDWAILKEYQNNVSNGGQKKPGSAFLKWLLQNQGTPARCHQIALTKTLDRFRFEEFPDHIELRDQVDPSDCVFIAVANKHPMRPHIWQASDSKWLNWKDSLEECGIHVDFLCPEDIQNFLDA
jgi:hypothetical protein